jgi:hypothetical protein
MIMQTAMIISLGLLAALGAATWYLAPKTSETQQAKNLAWSKYCERLVAIELDFHDRFNQTSTPAGVEESQESPNDIYGGVRELANHYVVEREALIAVREKIKTTAISIHRLRQGEILNFMLYVLAVIILVCLHDNGFSRWWIYAVVWAFPWLGLWILNSLQTNRRRVLDE